MKRAQGKVLLGLGLAAGLLGSPACFQSSEHKVGGDRRAPVAAITSPADGFATNLTTLLITGTASDAHQIATVKVFGCRGGGPPAQDTPCYPESLAAGKLLGKKIQPVTAASLTGNFETWSATLEFFGGGGQILDYTIRVATMDDQGNYNDDAVSITVTIDLSGPDIFGPDLTVFAPREGQVIGAADIPVSGTARDVNTVTSVTVDPGTGPVAAIDLGAVLPYSSWRADVNLAAGANVLTVTALDDQVPANSTTVVINVTRDARGNMTLITTPSAVTLGYNGGSETERPEHTVNLSDYYLDQYEVTLQDYKLCWDSLACDWNYGEDWDPAGIPNFELIPLPGREKYPVRGVTQSGAVAFCQWNGGKRLPTEAEWERAARAGSAGPAFLPDGRLYPGGNTVDCAAANIQGCMGHVVAVGGYPANPLGIYDLAGNVMEWVQDYYQDDYYTVLEPLPVMDPLMNTEANATCGYGIFVGGDCSYMSCQMATGVTCADVLPGSLDTTPCSPFYCFVNRGGSYMSADQIARASFRNYYDDPAQWGGDFMIGFRCAADGP